MAAVADQLFDVDPARPDEGGVQPVRVEGVGGGRAGPGCGAAALGLGGAPGPAGREQ